MINPLMNSYIFCLGDKDTYSIPNKFYNVEVKSDKLHKTPKALSKE